MSVEASEIIDCYRAFAKIPACSSAKISSTEIKNSFTIKSVWSQKDLERSESILFVINYLIDIRDENIDILLTTEPFEITSELLCIQNSSDSLKAILRKISSKKCEEKQYIEIWCKTHKIYNYDFAALEKHGKIYEDDQFGCFEWSSHDTHLLYVAEKNRPKAISFFDTKFNPELNQGDVAETFLNRGQEYIYREEWGEMLMGKHQPILCVMDISEGSISLLENLPEYISPGQAIWTPDDAGIVCVGWWNSPYRLGLKFCPIRRSALFHIEFQKGSYSIIGNNDKSVRCPVFNRDKSRLIYLENDFGGAHHKSSRLMMCNWMTKEISVIVDTVNCPTGDNFPGIYVTLLPKRCWAEDGIRIVMHTVWRTGKEIIVVNSNTKEVSRITQSAHTGAWTLLDIKDNILIATLSSINEAPHLMAGILPKIGQEKNIKWIQLDRNYKVFSEITWRIATFSPTPERCHPKYKELTYEGIYMKPVQETTNKIPLIVWPHGGPHSAFVPEFNRLAAIMTKLGFSVLLVNYRGSTGFGEDNLNSLIGNIGTQDVQDVQFAAEAILSTENIDYEKIYLFGGSHGGFLSIHLIGQYPDFYKACVCRNPVINLISKIGSTDIPDWAFSESGLTFDYSCIPSSETLNILWSKSPLIHADKIKIPTLLLVGTSDLRVPPKQSHELYRFLLYRGIPVKMLCYADNHSLDKVEVESDGFINSILWFLKY